MNLQHLGCWNHFEKLAEMLLNTFHREHILLILKIKKLLRKIKSKNLTAGVTVLTVSSSWSTVVSATIRALWEPILQTKLFMGQSGLEVINLCMLNSTEHSIDPAQKTKMSASVAMLTSSRILNTTP